MTDSRGFTYTLSAPTLAPAKSRGFSLIELMVATSVFLIVGGAAFSLFQRHTSLFTDQQNQVALNVSMRNALSLMQIDVVNAGTGYYAGANISSWPIGVTVINNKAAGSCYNAGTSSYSAGCFDRLNIISTDANTPPSHPDNGGSNCVSSTAAALFATPSAGTTAAALAADFKTGDQLLIVKGDGSQMTTTILTSDGSVVGPRVQLQHNPTAADGSNSTTNDPLGLTTNPGNKLGTTFCPADWILKISPVSYSVDTTDATDPKLIRTQGGVDATVADQVIGFKIGASIWNAATATSNDSYNFDASTYAFDYSSIRSLRISMIGRTARNTTGILVRNAFDGGPYRIEAISTVINPRNLSMKDN
jgi:prepilin-type N-terminal cleavage/methylation domain-containing protein